MNKVIIIVILALCAIEIRAQGCSSGEPSTAAGQFFCSVDPEKRDHLVLHYLTDALVANGFAVFPDQRVSYPRIYFGSSPPADFAQNLLAWVAEIKSSTYVDIAVIVSSANPVSNSNVCTDVCYDGTFCNPDKDIGCTCCPW